MSYLVFSNVNNVLKKKFMPEKKNQCFGLDFCHFFFIFRLSNSVLRMRKIVINAIIYTISYQILHFNLHFVFEEKLLKILHEN